MKERDDNPVRSIQKAAAILDIIAEEKRPMSLTELAEATGWARPLFLRRTSAMPSLSWNALTGFTRNTTAFLPKG